MFKRYDKTQDKEPEMKRAKLEVRNVGEDTSERDTKYAIGNVAICNVNIEGAKAVVFIGDVPIYSLVDSGCPKNIIDDQTLCLMQSQGVVVKNTRFETDKKFSGYGRAPLKQLLAFDALVKIKDGEEIVETFYVIEKGGQPLLGKETSEKLGILKINLPSHEGVVPINHLQVKISPFPKIIGVKIRLPVRQEVTPVCQPLRRSGGFNGKSKE